MKGSKSIPYGYKYDKQKHRLTLNKEEMDSVVKVFRYYSEGKDINEIAWILNNDN